MLLKSFYEKNGHCSVPRKGYKISVWVHTQRDNYNHGTLSEWKKNKLDLLNFSIKKIENTWINNYNDLKEFYSIHGHSNVSKNHKLWNWCNEQRKNKKYKRLKSQDKIEKLNSINFVWSIYRSSWDEKYLEMQEYSLDHGSCKVPKRHKLNNWVLRQKRDFKEGKINEERINKLSFIGFTF